MASNGSVSNGVEPTIFTLHVKNLPLNLEKVAVSNIFLEYGQLNGCMTYKDKNNTNQAYISYSKYAEAERAINELHEKPPLMLDIQFKDKNLKDYQKIEQEVNLSHPINDIRYRYNHLDLIQGKRKITKANCTPVHKSNSYTSEDELLYPVPEDILTFNPYEPPHPYEETNLMYTRGAALVSRDGRTRIAFGRGCTYYNLPEPRYNIETYLQNVCEKRDNGFYEFAAEDQENDTGNCKICSSPTSFQCQKCSITFYCSKTCQVKDWPTHKLECSPVPPLVKKKINQEENKLQQFTPLCRPKVQQENQEQNQEIVNEARNFVQQQKQQSPVPACTESIKSNSSHTVGESKSNLNNKTFSTGNFKVEATSFPAHKQISREIKIGNLRRPVSKTSEENIVFQSNIFLPKGKFTKVFITESMKNGEYWVTKVEEFKKLDNLTIELKEHCKKLTKVYPEENMKCIIQSVDTYFRGTIESIIDNRMRIIFNDLGTTEDRPVDMVYPCNFDKPYFARRIRLIEESDTKLKTLNPGQQINVKAISVEPDGIINVIAQEIKEENERRNVNDQMAKCSINTVPLKQPSTPQEVEPLKKLLALPHILDKLKVGQHGVLVTNAILSQDEYSMSLITESEMPNFNKLLENLKNVCLIEPSTNNKFLPKVGDFICGQAMDGEWYRGIVFSTNPVIRLASIDDCRFFVPAHCTPLPSGYDFSTFGVVSKSLSKTKPLGSINCETTLQFTVQEISNDSVVLSVDGEGNDKLLVEKWIPRPEQKGIEWAKLISGKDVLITVFSSQNLIYVRSLETEEVERVFKLEQNVSLAALKREPLCQIPVVGEMVMAQFLLDENYYRAIVIKVEDKAITIKYVDYGNEEVTAIKNLFALPEKLKTEPSAVAKISFKDVDKKIPLTTEAKSYIDELITNKAALKCTFTGHPFKDGVILTEPNNENVNEKFKEYIKPNWEKAHDEEVTYSKDKGYFLNDLPILPIGDVGDEVEVMVLEYYENNGYVVLAPNDYVACEAIQVQMTESIRKYVSETTTHYIPRENELCLAKYEDEFYRGVCLEICSPTECRIFFIDFGNTERIKNTDIRMITKDFLNIGSFGTLCSTIPIVPDDKLTARVSKRMSELIKPNETVTIKIISSEEDQLLHVDIPSVRVKLIEEHLI